MVWFYWLPYHKKSILVQQLSVSLEVEHILYPSRQSPSSLLWLAYVFTLGSWPWAISFIVGDKFVSYEVLSDKIRAFSAFFLKIQQYNNRAKYETVTNKVIVG